MVRLQQTEEQMQKDKVQARREIDAQKKKLSNMDHRYSQLQAGIQHLHLQNPANHLSSVLFIIGFSCCQEQEALSERAFGEEMKV